jgi:nucleotide-binding universal stress UspA family protein
MWAMRALVLCAVARDDHAQAVIAAGRRLAATGRFRPLFVHVAEPALAGAPAPTPLPGIAEAAMRPPPAETLEELEEAALRHGEELLRAAGVEEDEERLVTTGDPVAELRRIGREQEAALIAVGCRGRGAIAASLLGSVSRSLACQGGLPVLIPRAGALPGEDGPVVCGVQHDEDRPSLTAARTAAKLAASLERPLVLAHVIDSGAAALAVAGGGPVPAVAVEPGEREHREARRVLEAVAAQVGAPDADLVVLEGRPAPELDALASEREAALLAVGCHGGGLLRALFEGAVSVDLARSAHRPLVIVPPDTA